MVEISSESFKRADMITVSGRIDSSNATELDSALAEVTDNDRYNIVLDLSGIEYMSSAGLRAIVGSYRECRTHGGDVRIANPSDRAREVFDLAGLTAIFTIYDDSTSAVGSF
jgi:anti-sigma B factor antagonist